MAAVALFISVYNERAKFLSFLKHRKRVNIKAYQCDIKFIVELKIWGKLYVLAEAVAVCCAR